MLVSSSAYSSTLKMEAIRSSETSVDFQRVISQKIVLYYSFVCFTLFRAVEKSILSVQLICLYAFPATTKWFSERCPTVNSYTAQKPDDTGKYYSLYYNVVSGHRPNYSM
jgi:hypothetical protein